MDFAHPWILLLLIPFLLLFFLLKKLERRRYNDIPTALSVRRIGLLKSFFKTSGKILWILSCMAIIIALSGPQSVTTGEKISIEGRMIVLSVDLSTSMTGSYYSKENRPSIDVIKDLAQEFVKKRATTDLVGITAYGGKGRGKENGQAAIMLFPTSEYNQIKKSVKILKPGMLGMYTSIGDGILLSIFCLLDHEMLKEIDIPSLIQSLESEDRSYALNMVRKLGHYRNRVIVLFTDGKNNSGLEPSLALWLAKMLGIKVYFAALESTGVTGLSDEEQIRQKNLLIEGVLDAGGKYYETKIVEETKEFYNEIDKLETARLEFTDFEKKKDLSFLPAFAGLILLFTGVLLENIFPRIQ